MYKYPKIDNLYTRAIDGTKKLVEGVFNDETVAFLADIPWHATEKIDGTNIGIYWDGHEVHFQGRTERSVIPKHLFEKLVRLFGGETNAQIFEQLFGEKEVVLYGEGYGHKIQAAGDSYNPNDVNFVLFDIYIPGNDLWLVRCDMCRIADAFGIYVVPWLGTAPLKDWVEYVKEKNHSLWAADDDYIMEGVVCKPAVELRNKRGERIIVKIKWRDFE